MKTMIFAGRNLKEMLRDPLTLSFGLGFPLAVLLLLTAIQANVPVAVFELRSLTPGIAVFGFSFIALFSGMLIAKDRSDSFMMRLFASPLTASNFIVGYVVPLLPMALAQAVICYIAALILGLAFNANIIMSLLTLIPSAFLYIAIGLLCGTVFNDKQVGGFCGALLTNLTAWLSGTWFDLKLVGGAFEKIAYLLPFAHACDAGKAAIAGDYASIWPHLIWVIVYAALLMALAVVIFRRKMGGDKA